MVSEDLIDGGEEGVGVGVAADGQVLVRDVPPSDSMGLLSSGE